MGRSNTYIKTKTSTKEAKGFVLRPCVTSTSLFLAWHLSVNFPSDPPLLLSLLIIVFMIESFTHPFHTMCTAE